METKTGTFYIATCRCERTNEQGAQVKVNEKYVFDAVSWSDCEAMAVKEVGTLTTGEFDITAMKKAKFSEVVLVDDASAYYLCTVSFITIDEHSGKEKRTKACYLVQGTSLNDARKNIDALLNGSMVDYTISTISETDIIDVITK